MIDVTGIDGKYETYEDLIERLKQNTERFEAESKTKRGQILLAIPGRFGMAGPEDMIRALTEVSPDDVKTELAMAFKRIDKKREEQAKAEENEKKISVAQRNQIVAEIQRGETTDWLMKKWKVTDMFILKIRQSLN